MKSYFKTPLQLLRKARDLDHAELLTALHLYCMGQVNESRNLVTTTTGLVPFTGKGRIKAVMKSLHDKKIIKVKKRYKYYKHIGKGTTWFIQLSMLPLKVYQDDHRKK